MFPADMKFSGGVENFLICLNLTKWFKSAGLIDDAQAKKFEQVSLKGISESLKIEIKFPEAELLISEIPFILKLPYHEVKVIREQCLKLISQIMLIYKMHNYRKGFHKEEYIGKLIATG